jgi:NAD kinase
VSQVVAADEAAARGCELVVVFGGDGSILRGAELARPAGVPLLGVNLGHVGFLAEADRDEMEVTVERVVARSYEVEERLTVDVDVWTDGILSFQTWALNEASVEKASRQRLLEAVVEVDGRPVSRFGCDGVVFATPTGSTAYNFSAGGPIVWPQVQALLMVPISAHALFARPMVVSRTPCSPWKCWRDSASQRCCGVTGEELTRCCPELASRFAEESSRCCSPDWAPGRSRIDWCASSSCPSAAGAAPRSAAARSKTLSPGQSREERDRVA